MIVLYMVFLLTGDGGEKPFSVASADPADCVPMMDAARKKYPGAALVCRPGKFTPDYSRVESKEKPHGHK